MKRRNFLKAAAALVPFGGALSSLAAPAAATHGSLSGKAKKYNPEGHRYGMGVRVDRCIGCARCVRACKIENDVPQEPFFVRTWVERYSIKTNETVVVENIENGADKPSHLLEEKDILRSFCVPKLCNHCENPPCVQVCPVGATFATRDGVVLVDGERCIGCRYCIQACPYGARYLHPVSHTADKCTFCYHRITAGLLPACVEVCPTHARVFGEIGERSSPLTRFRRMNTVHVLKPALNTRPKVFYSNLDGEVR